MARILHDKGYHEVRPLLGGFDGWLELGYPVESHKPVTVQLESLAASRPGH